MALFLQDSLLAFSALILAVMSICCLVESLYLSRRAAKGLHLSGSADEAETYPLLEKAPVSADDQVKPTPVASFTVSLGGISGRMLTLIHRSEMLFSIYGMNPTGGAGSPTLCP